jgi:hypothetical protein
MPAQRPQRPATRARVMAPADDYDTRMLSDAAQQTADQIRDRSRVVVNLVVGANVVTHRLGRAPTVVAITPTVADATWAWALTAKDARQATITCVGVAQPGASLEFA